MRIDDRLAGLLMVFFGIGVVFHARTFPPTLTQGIGPGVFPIVLGLGIVLGGAVLAWTGWRQRSRAWIELDEGLREPRMALNGVLVIGALVFYALVVDTAGFFITSFAILTVLFVAFGVKWRWIGPLAVGVTLGLHVAFYTLLRVPLPWGWLEEVAW